MRYKSRNSKRIAVTLLLLMAFNILAPSVALALTSGPAQPETKGFQPAGVADMVDVQNGDFKYNIPLFDIDGYPVNLNYESGTGIDDEASWVGLGWSLTPGAINRQLRGLPDDFLGDKVETDHYTKPKVTVGGRLTAKVETFGIAHLSGSFSFGVFSDNYTGIGAEFGVNAGISASRTQDSYLTAGLGVGVLSNTQTGVDVTPYVSLSVAEKSKVNYTTDAGLTGSLGYNTRSGMKSLSLAASFSVNHWDDFKELDGATGNSVGGSAISYNTQTFSPTIQIPYSSTYSSYSFDIGGTAWGVFLGGGGTGYQSVRQVKNFANIKPAYGFLYAEKGKNDPDAVMDFIREKDNPIIPGLPDIALPVQMPDLWSYTSQTGGGQFRLYRGGTGIFFDNQSADASQNSSLGFDIGVGAIAHGGVTLFNQQTQNTTNKWQNQNNYVKNGDFQDESTTNPKAQHVYFRRVGEKGLEDQELSTKVLGTQPLAVNISGTQAYSTFRTGTGVSNTGLINKTSHRGNRTGISFLTAAQATSGALDLNIKSYPVNDSATFTLPALHKPVGTALPRVDSYHQAQHISELTVTDDGGKRMVYGIPVYNTLQDEYTFAVGDTGKNYSVIAGTHNQVQTPTVVATPTTSTLGIDNYYQKEHKPAYATSFLLTAVLSPDYVDKTGNGISDDDLGTAIKFNYAKLPYTYKWRTPYQNATLNKGLLADPDDDKGSIVYGEKEVWYVSSIESKTKIAYFITQNRRDALGVKEWSSGGVDTSNRLKLLKEIRLYAKSDMSKPIKVVKFQYSYELCRGIPNSADFGSSDTTKGGKLTLKRVWFQYGNSDKGKYHPYIFQYNKSTPAYSNVAYSYLSTDRWGTYKNNAENATGLDNELYPYADQNRAFADANCALWHLNQVSLPTGGFINVNYESNDYSYVQDKKAMVMTGIQSLISSPSTTVSASQLNKAKGLQLNIGTSLIPPAGADQTKWFKANFLNGSDYLYTKLYVRLSTNLSNTGGKDYYDYVPCYAQIGSVSVASGIASILFTDINESGVSVNPISIAAWQRMKNEYPRYAYPGYDNRIQSGNSSIAGAVTAIVNAARNLSELRQNFYQKANANGYGCLVNLAKSFVKIVKTDGHKLGGGARVKKIYINDDWNVMSGNTSVPAGAYGQAYAYTTTENGNVISSGVATYEPAIGSDENAMREPVPYIQNIKGAINNYFDLEKPFGESFYPAPTVGYSKVTVNDLDKNGNPSQKTGYTVNEFYTAKDFPVRVNVMPLNTQSYKPASYFSLVKSNSVDDLTLSQGYSIELNDMHGKVKATRIFNQTGSEISSTVYTYNVDSNGFLNNSVSIIGMDGTLIPNQVIGRDMEFFTDLREQITSTKGQAINIGFDIIPVFFLPFIPHFPININNSTQQFRSACGVKVIQTYGIVSKVTKTVNGSSITTQNLAYDGLTGEALVTQTQNEFNQNIYSVNIPAYWAYPNMGGAYQTSGVLLSNLQTDASGKITSTYKDYLTTGDELTNLALNTNYWVTVDSTGTSKMLIDRNGMQVASLNASLTNPNYVKITRSGFRNMLNASVNSIACLNYPFSTDTVAHKTTLGLVQNRNLTGYKVINASASTYKGISAVRPRCIGNSTTVTNTGYNFSFTAGTPSSSNHGVNGVVIYNTAHDGTYSTITNAWLQGRMDNTSIWLNPVTDNFDKPIGFETDINLTWEFTGYIGYSGDNSFQYVIDGVTLPVPSSIPAVGANPANTYWFLYPLYLDQGKHHIKATATNISNASLGLGSTNDTQTANPGAIAIEFYNNTLSQIESHTSLVVPFTTTSLIGSTSPSFVTDATGHTIYHYVTRNYINPYIDGYLGNWRPYQTKVFQQARYNKDIFNTANNILDIKKSGYIQAFYNYWYYNTTAGLLTTNTATGAQKWTTANTVTLYDIFGQELENQDALGRFSAAQFGFNGQLPVAVSSNAMNREIYTDSFEDAGFLPGYVADTACTLPKFAGLTNNGSITTTLSHSGNAAFVLPSGGTTLNTVIQSRLINTDSLFTRTDHNEYNTRSGTGYLPGGFQPMPGKNYVFDVWVNDANPNDKSVNLAFTINGGTTGVALTCKAVVEGWKLLEGRFTTGVSGPLSLTINKASGYSGSLTIDDIRIFPYNAQVKTYAYDAATLHLMAELDENGFATFYEYDDEGLLVRVKKETEKGVMTIKESRSSYRRNPH